MGIRVGIDLGTTFSAVARIDPQTGKPVIIKNSYGASITPSVLCFQEDGSVLFGEEAKNMQGIGDPNAIAFFKRSMGKDNFASEFFGKTYTPTELSSILLHQLKEEAEEESGETIDSAVITVPAYFNQFERTATIKAAELAGIEVQHIINEPTSAAFAYGLNEKVGAQTVMIYDLGGGTFDVTLAHIDQNNIQIIGCDGNHELGGKDWDDAIARYIYDVFEQKHQVDICQHPEMCAKILVMSETAKKQLTLKDAVTVPVVFGDIREEITVTLDLFEEVTQTLMMSTEDIIDNLFEQVHLSWADVDGVILVGGSTRMRMIHNYVTELSGKPPLAGINVDEAVALGAAIRANITHTGDTLMSIGGKTAQTSLPTIQGAKAISDVTAHSLGMIAISQDGNSYVNSTIIPKNSKIPAVEEKPFHFATRRGDNELEVYVLQGDFPRPLDNTIIHKYVIHNIEKTSNPKSVIVVKNEYNSDGVVLVSALQEDTGKTLPVRIEVIPEDMMWTDEAPQSSGSTVELEIMLALDMSGSMSGVPLKEAKKAMNDFVDQMQLCNGKIGVIPFSDKAVCEIKPTHDSKKVKAVVEELSICPKYGIGNSANPFKIAMKHMSTARSTQRYIVVLTDGLWAHSKQAVSDALSCRKDGVEIIAMGFGSADGRFLEEIASQKEFATLTELSHIGATFSHIAQVIGGE